MEIIELLQAQHADVKTLFRRIEAAEDRDEAENFLVQIIDRLQLHMTIEENIFYPDLEAAGGDSADVQHGFAEHAEVKELTELLLFNPPDAEMKTLVKKLIASVERHVAEEEKAGGLFSKARKVFDHREMREEAKRARVLQSQFNNGDL